MILKDFELLDGVPEGIEYFAERAAGVTDCPSLQIAASNYLIAEEAIFEALEECGARLG